MRGDIGIRVCLQSESGDVISEVVDSQNLLHRHLTINREDMLSGIDCHGDTIFNRIQMQQFVPAWENLVSDAADPQEETLLQQILTMARSCANGVHTCLVFEGD